MTGDLLISRLFNLLYNRADIETVPQLIDIYDRDNRAEIERDIDGYVADYLGRTVGDAMFLGVHCQEEVPFNDMAKAIAAYRRYPMLAGWRWGRGWKFCRYLRNSWRSALPQQPLRATDTQPVVSDLPTLVLSGLFDPVTPPVYGRMAASHLVNGFYVEFDGVGHDALGNDNSAPSPSPTVSWPTRSRRRTMPASGQSHSAGFPAAEEVRRSRKDRALTRARLRISDGTTPTPARPGRRGCRDS